MQSKRTRHTASYLLSHFLNSKNSLEIILTPCMIAVLRYVYDVIDMNYNQFGKEIFNKPIPQIATYSRVSERTIKRMLPYLVDKQLLKIIQRSPRTVTIFGIGELIKSGVTMTPEVSQNESESGVTMTLDDSREEKSRVTMTPGWGHHDPSTRVTMAPLVRTSSNKDCKTERESLSLDQFLPNEANQTLCYELKLNLDEELKSFKNRHSGKGKLQYEFERWIKGSREHHDKNGQKLEVKPPKSLEWHELKKQRQEEEAKYKKKHQEQYQQTLNDLANEKTTTRRKSYREVKAEYEQGLLKNGQIKTQ